MILTPTARKAANAKRVSVIEYIVALCAIAIAGSVLSTAFLYRLVIDVIIAASNAKTVNYDFAGAERILQTDCIAVVAVLFAITVFSALAAVVYARRTRT